MPEPFLRQSRTLTSDVISDELHAVPECPARPLLHVLLESVCYIAAFVMPWLLKPVIHGALPSEEWRMGAMAAVASSLFATGIFVRVRWPLSWFPACSLTAVSSVIISPWHALTVAFAIIAILVLLATQVFPGTEARGTRRSPVAPVLLLIVSSLLVGYALLRMSVAAGFPLSLAQALHTPRVALLYLRDNPGALAEETPGGVPLVLYAAKHAAPVVLEAILAAGATVSPEDQQRLGSPLEWFASNVDFADPHAEAKARLLVRYGVKPAGAATAARRGHHSLAGTLIALGDDVNAPDARGRSALAALIEANAVSAVACLLANGVQVGSGSLQRGGRTPPGGIPSPAMREILTQYGQEQWLRTSP